MKIISRLSTVVTVDSVRKARIVWFSWKRAKMSPVLRLAKNEYGSDSVCLKNCDIMSKSSLRTMKFASFARIVAMSWVNTCETIRPTISRCSRLTFVVHDHAVQDVLDDHRRNDPEHLDHEGRQEQMEQDLLVGDQVPREPHPGRSRRSHLRHVLRRA